MLNVESDTHYEQKFFDLSEKLDSKAANCRLYGIETVPWTNKLVEKSRVDNYSFFKTFQAVESKNIDLFNFKQQIHCVK